MIDRGSPVPPHRQVAEIIAQRIRDGEITRRLPSIVDLTQEFGVARSTAAKALRQLVADGYAELSVGMGYYVRRDH